jgi:murein L,D-transpeptidase YcbB/YkuD
VGRALRTQTPVFVEEMRHVVFRPYWNVPPSILRNEILPVLARDAGYLKRQNMEIVSGAGDDADVLAVTPENIARLRQGTARLRQRPGPDNALGLVKFVFPNDENVYMHGTPAQQLFARSRRDFSHGCVRLEDPVALAQWVLSDQPEWTRERILAAMAGPAPRQVNLSRPLRVILFYTTAAVMPDDGTVRFAEDIYGHDAKLARALGASPLP